jgi:hypothetical protein
MKGACGEKGDESRGESRPDAAWRMENLRSRIADEKNRQVGNLPYG